MASELTEALDHLDMLDFLEYEGIDYKERTGSSGPQFNIQECPSCGDRKWRVWLNQESGLGNCFHGDCTQKTFNKYSFVRETLGNPPAKDVITYLKRLAAKHGWRPKRVATVATAPTVYEGDLFPTRCVPTPDEFGNHMTYLSDRGISAELSKEFGLCYCDGGEFRLRNFAEERETIQYYGERIVVPIFNLEGDQVTFQGRDITGTSDRKYLFPPGLPASGRFLYGANLAKGKKEIVVTEGAFDYWSVLLAMRGDVDLADVGVTATFGMHLSDNLSSDGDDQVGCFVKLQRLGLQRVTFMWDGEVRALKKALDAALRLQRLGLRARVAILPDGKDPNEMRPEEIVTCYYSAKDLAIPGQKIELLRQLL